MREARTVRRVQKFSDLAEPLHQESDSLEAAITLLTQTRDPLLPRVIYGKLSVADLDIQFAPSICEETEGVDRKEQELRGEAQPPATSQEGSRP
jgi:hypothetical protein